MGIRRKRIIIKKTKFVVAVSLYTFALIAGNYVADIMDQLFLMGNYEPAFIQYHNPMDFFSTGLFSIPLFMAIARVVYYVVFNLTALIMYKKHCSKKLISMVVPKLFF